FDRAEVELAFAGAMLGDIAVPQLIWRIGGEVTLDQIIVDRWPDLAILAALLPECAPPAVLGTDPPRGSFGHLLAGIAGLLDQVAVAELRIVAVSVEQRVGPLRFKYSASVMGIGQPAVVGLAGEL